MGIDAEAWRLGYAAHRDGLYDQYTRIVRIAITNTSDNYVRAWLSGWYDFPTA